MDNNWNCNQNFEMNQGCPKGSHNVVNKYFYQDVAVPVNYHTHVINNVVKRYHGVPYCTYSEETVYLDECPCSQYGQQNQCNKQNQCR